MKKNFKSLLLKIIDNIFSPLTVISLIWLKFIRKEIVGLWHSESKTSLKLFRKIGLFPIKDDFYEPLFNTQSLEKPLNEDRNLPGIDFNESEQLRFLESFNFSNEIMEISKLKKDRFNYTFSEGSFLSGDSEILYSIIRKIKPNKVVEIGCGQSSLMIQHALKRNLVESSKYSFEHICIEPYANDWLENLDATIIREKVENVALDVFKSLKPNDVLFIDSSHIIRPQGDVLFEYLQILPSLNAGVYVHIHDIFTPKDYLKEWLQDGLNFWNEQYLLEAYLSNNNQFEIVLALNFLKHKHYKSLKANCPMLEHNREPGSMWIKKV